MARAIGSNVDFVFNSVALEDELNSIGLDFNVPEAEITAFTDAYQNFLAGKPGLTYQGSGSWDGASNQGDATIFAALGAVAKTIDVEPDGTTGYDGFAFPTSYSIAAAVNGPVTYDVTFRHNGGAAAADGAAPTRA